MYCDIINDRKLFPTVRRKWLRGGRLDPNSSWPIEAIVAA